jgi:hypothetical protein
MVASSLVAASVELTLTTTVEGESLIKLSNNALNPGHGHNGWDEASVDLTMFFEDPDAQEAYVNLLRNTRSAYVVKIEGGPLSAPDVSTTIGYTITPLGGNSFYSPGYSLTVTSGTSTADPFITFNSHHGGRQVVPAKFSVELNASDFANASSSEDYSTIVEFTLTTV